MPRFSAVRMLSLATLLVPVAFGQNTISARPGTLNYIEGQASIEGKPLSPASVGHTELVSGQYLATANGKAELLLTPGVFLRLDNNSTVKMVSPDLTRTEIQVTQGRASVEADQLYKDNRILIDENGAQTQLLKNGLYEFNAANNTVRVFDGRADVFSNVTPQSKEKPITLKGGKQLTLTGEAVKPANFNKKELEATDGLYRWGSLRSAYLGEENVNIASSYAGSKSFSPGWFSGGGLGYTGYTWLPGGYNPFFSPFGYGFYSPGYIYGGGPIYGYGYGGYGGGYGGYGGGYGNSGTTGSGNRGGIGSGNRGVIQSGTASRPAPSGGGSSASHGSASGGSISGGSVGSGGGAHR